jgi:preprotein translocase subunit YajC
MQDAVAAGDEVISAGGIHGTVIAVGDEDLRVEIAPDVVVTLDRRAVAAVATGDVEADVDADEEDDEGEDEEPDEPANDPNGSERSREAS